MITGLCPKCSSDEITVLVSGDQITVNVKELYTRIIKTRIGNMKSCLYICGNSKCQHPRGE